MATNFNVASRLYAPGDYIVPIPQNLQHKFSHIDLQFTRENWPLTTSDIVMNVELQRSIDGGATWLFVSGGGFNGGTFLKNGVAVAVQYLSFDWPAGQDGDLQLVAHVLQALTTAISGSFS